MIRRNVLALLAAAPLAPLALSAAAAAAEEPTTAQPDLPKEKLVIITHEGKPHDFMVEMATTPKQQEIGLMFRTSVPPDGGMLFDWGSPRISQMWMRNTVSSLDMIFIDQDGVIRRIVENTVPQSLAIIDSLVPVKATLEAAAGTAARLDIRVGDKVQAKLFGNLPK
jgi:uncharacterized membrane protein (UPF0127 family)